VMLGKSTAKTLEMLCEASGEHSLSQTAVFEWHSHFQGRSSVSWQWRSSGRPGTCKTTENVEKFQNSSTKTVAKQSMNWQTPLGSVVEFARRS
jgi:hypothetical protein